jgi:hypothetical protein
VGGVCASEQGNPNAQFFGMDFWLIDMRMLQDISESADAIKRKQKIKYDSLGEQSREKTTL